MSRFDVVALGELLIDFTENGLSSQGNPVMEANPGGAPCNLLAMLARLNRKTAFIGKVGNDMFGHMLKDRVTSLGIDTTFLYVDKDVNTTLAFVHTYEDGDRDFSFYRNPGADMMLTSDEVPCEMIKDSRIFHFGTLSMTHNEVREATRKAVSVARESGVIVSFDPNFRSPLWSSDELAKEQVHYGLSNCDILKISDNEIQWFTGLEDYDEGIKYLKDNYNIKLIVLSMGRDGSRAYMDDFRVEVPAVISDNTIETTGAGDTFGGCILNYVLEHDLDNLSEKNLAEMLEFANAAASIVTTRRGALCVMPTPDEINSLMKSK